MPRHRRRGAIGLTHLSHFQDVDKPTPVILTTSQLLTTGVDAEMVKNVVLARVVGSRSEFKQIVGRGTRLKVDYGKEYFNIIDFTGTATHHFADPDFDGEPARIEEATIDETGELVEATTNEPPAAAEPEAAYLAEPEQDETPDGGGEIITDPPAEPRKFYIDGGEVEVASTQGVGTTVTVWIPAAGKKPLVAQEIVAESEAERLDTW